MNRIVDTVGISGRLKIEVFGAHGELKECREIDNLVVTAGKNYIASRMKDASATAMSHMAVGTGSTAADAADTALETEAGRVALTSTTVTNNQVAYVATFPAGTGTGALVEAGILNAASNGTLLCRTTFAVVNKGASDAITITWTVTVG